MDLSYIFAPAQAYVALSRAVDPQKIIINPPRKSLHSIFYIDQKVKDFYNNYHQIQTLNLVMI